MALLPTDGQTVVRGRRRSNIELTLVSTSIPLPSPSSSVHSMWPPSLPLALSLSSFNLSITCKKSRLRTTEGGREWRLRRARACQGGAGEANTSSPPSSRSLGACCLRAPKSQLSVALCGAKDLRGMQCSAGPRVREDCWKEGRVGWRRCTL